MSSSMLLGFFGMPGQIEMLIVLAVMLLLFGHRLPGLMRSMGRGIVEFKKGVQGIEDEVESATQGDSKKSENGNISKPIGEK